MAPAVQHGMQPANKQLIILSVRSIDVKKRSNKNKKRQKT